MIPFDQLKDNSLFQDWQKNNQDVFLSHFFCQLNPDLKLIGAWEIGYYNEAKEKITVFVINEQVQIKPEDDVFKKPQEKIEPLEMEKVKISFAEAKKIFSEKFSEYFPKANLGDGFLILQTIKEKVLWNFTFIDKRLKFLNLKIDAASGEIEDHQEMELIQK